MLGEKAVEEVVVVEEVALVVDDEVVDLARFLKLFPILTRCNVVDVLKPFDECVDRIVSAVKCDFGEGSVCTL